MLGFVLIAASVFKADALLDIGYRASAEWWRRCVPAALELILGMWLLSGLFQLKSWYAALTCFSTFLGININQGVAGEVSCSCFGRVALSPWWTACLDGAAVACLVMARPATATMRWKTTLTVCLLLFVFAALAMPSLEATRRFSAGAWRSDEPSTLHPSPPEIAFGKLPRGRRVEVSFWLSNPGSKAVRVDGIDTDCDGVRIELSCSVVEPGAKINGLARLDLREKPGFSGKLRFKITGWTGTGARAFTIIARAEVGA